MAYFAEIDEMGTVLRVIVADQSFINSGIVGDPSMWKETDMSGQARKNYAAKGYTYDTIRDAFIPPNKFTSWTLDEEKAVWKPPTEAPKDGKEYTWKEDTLSWVETIK